MGDSVEKTGDYPLVPNGSSLHVPSGLTNTDIRKMESVLYGWARWWNGASKVRQGPRLAVVNWSRMMGQESRYKSNRDLQALYSAEYYQQIHAIWSAMGEPHKSIVRMRYHFRMKNKVIAQRLNLPKERVHQCLDETWIKVYKELI